MKILLCYPPVAKAYNSIRDSGLAPHLSTLCIASHLKQVFDDLDFCILDGHHVSREVIEQEILRFRPDLIGYSVDFTNYHEAVLISRFAKENVSGVWNVCGSNHATNLCEEILRNQPSMDFVSLFDGEPSWEDLVRIRKGEMAREKEEADGSEVSRQEETAIVRTRTENMELTYMADVKYGMVDLEAYFRRQGKVLGEGFRMLQFTSQRGCANKPLCVFCGRYTDGIRFRDPEKP